MRPETLNRPRRRLVDMFMELAVVSVGPLFLFVLRVAERYSNRRNFRGCNRVGARVEAGFDLGIDNAGFISLADDVSFSNGVRLSCYQGGSIKIGRNCFFGDAIKIVSDRANIWIDDDCLVADQVSIRAGNHGIKAGMLIRSQPNTVSDIWIGKDVWIGKGVTVLAGSRIADGCVIGANSVVRGSTDLNTIYAGAPIRKVTLRSQEGFEG